MKVARAIRGWRLALVGLGVWAAAGAVLPATTAAQVTPRPDTLRVPRDTVAIPIPPRADSLRADSLRADSLSADSLRADTTARRDTVTAPRDTVKPPLAAAPVPTEHDAGPAYVWDREAIFASGAHTLLDLLEQVPGVTGLRAGWLLPPETAAYNGAFGSIRVFLDGVELAPIVPRTGGLFDLSTIELWPLELVQVERGAGELRVHLRSWRVQRTIPDTRTDVATGQYRTNIFRGFFGRRLQHGEALQFGFQQFSTGDPQRGGDGDQLSLMGRAGWTVGRWSMDAFGTRRRRNLTELARREGGAPLPAMDGIQQFGYLRVGYRDPGAPGGWVQAVASHDGFRETTEFQEGTPLVPSDSADTTRSRPQYVLSAGWNQGPLRVTAVGRLSALDGVRYLTPVLRAEFDSRWGSVAARAERRAEDSTTRAEVVVEGRPLPWMSAVAAVGQTRSDGDDERAAVTSVRGELGVRVGRAWLLGGVLRSGDVATGAPSSFDRNFLSVTTGNAMAVYGGARAPIWGDLAADVLLTTWTGGSAQGIYRPQQQARAALTLDTRWLSRFPTGQFGLKATGGLAYRSSVLFPDAEGSALRTAGSTVISALLELRIQQVVAFVESRNTMGLDYELVPGYLMPRNVLLYGVRWQFWN